MAKLWSSWERSWNGRRYQLHYLLRSDYQFVDVVIEFSSMIIIGGLGGGGVPQALGVQS